jgi:glycosyltransferase involved in cell wall biosynthesis
MRVLRLRSPKTKDVGYVRRTLSEFWMPFAMRRQLKCSPLAHECFDGVVWYSPSIFHGPLVQALKRQSRCPSYLIIRDIFPEWAVDMGLMGRGLPYRVFDAVARYQYSVADVIGVQTLGNLAYFDRWQAQLGRRLEVLPNWLGAPAAKRCSIRLDETPLAGRKLFVYAGNMGVAQGMDTVMDWVAAMNGHVGVGFVFVGRGSDAQRLRKKAQDMGLSNVLFFDEIDPDEIPDLYAQCHVGLVALDPRHRSHNIPGKFLTYMQNGLPVLALVNKGNDLAALIREHQVGQVCESHHLPDILSLGEAVLAQTHHDPNLSARCRSLFEQAFSVEQTARQLVAALTGPQHA